MLKQVWNFARGNKFPNVSIKKSPAEYLPFRNNSLDCLFTFNAIHLFDCHQFLEEASRVLKEEGRLFIYTRLQNQNRNSVWGKYFPHFSQKETRLFELEDLEGKIHRFASLEVIQVKYFSYPRISSLDRLLEKARNQHYSTFCLYSPELFESCLVEFEHNIYDKFVDVKRVSWTDENVLLVVVKTRHK
jgi:ubiquinone/menaquinone biosynthesis C-methylase UbiE